MQRLAPASSHPDAEKRPAKGAVTEAPVDVPSLALGVNELRRWMGPRQASCRGSARPLHPLPFTSTALAGARPPFTVGLVTRAWLLANAVHEDQQMSGMSVSGQIMIQEPSSSGFSALFFPL